MGNCNEYLRLDNLVRYFNTSYAGKKFKAMSQRERERERERKRERDFSFMNLYDKRIILKGEEDIN